MNLTHTDHADRVKIPANHAVTKRLGNWTTARRFQVRAHRGSAVLDLRPDASGGRRIVVTGQLRSGEVRVRRGGIAMLSAMFSRAYWDDVRRAHKEGGFPTVDDPARTP